MPRKLTGEERSQVLGKLQLQGGDVPRPKKKPPALELRGSPQPKYPGAVLPGFLTPERPTKPEFTAEELGVSTEGAPYETRRTGGYGVEQPAKIGGIKKSLEEQFGRSVPVRVGPTERIEFLNPKTLKWTTYNPPGLDLGDIASMEAELYPTAGGVVGGLVGGAPGALAGSIPGAAAGGYAGEAIGSTLGEFQRLLKGQEEGVVSKDKTPTDLLVDAGVTGLTGLGLGLGVDTLANMIRRRIARQFNIDIDVDELKRRLKEKGPAHEAVGTEPTAGQTMRGTVTGDELLSAERRAMADQSDPLSRDLRRRERSNLQRAWQAFNEATFPNLDERQARAVEDIPGQAQERMFRERQQPLEEEIDRLRGEYLRTLDEVPGTERTTAEQGEQVRSALEQAQQEFYRRAEEEAYGPIRQMTRGLQTQPENLVETARQYSETIQQDLIPSLTQEDKRIVNDILRNVKETESPILDQQGRPIRQGQQLPTVGYDQLDRTLSVLRRTERMMQRGTIPERDRQMIRDLKAAVNQDMERLLQRNPEALRRKREADVWYSQQQQQLKEGVVDKLLSKRAGETSYEVPGEQVLEQVVARGGETAVRQIDDVLTDQDNGSARWALQEGLANVWRRNVIKDGEVDPQAHATFLDKYGPALERFMPQRLRQNMDDAAGFRQALQERQQRLDAVKEELRRTTDGRIASINPEEVFQKTWNDPELSREVYQLTGGDSVWANAYRYNIRQDIMRKMMSPARDVLPDDQVERSARGKMLDPKKMDEYLGDDQKRAQLRQWLGDDTVSQLESVSDVLRDVTARPRTTVREQGPVSAIYDLARAYVGMFTRPGRMVTAFRKFKRRDAQRDLSDAIMNPRKLARLNELANVGRGTQKATSILLAANIDPALTEVANPTREQIDQVNQPSDAGGGGARKVPKDQRENILEQLQKQGAVPQNSMPEAGQRQASAGTMQPPQPTVERTEDTGPTPPKPKLSGMRVAAMGPSDKLLDDIRQVESGGDPNAVSPVGARGAYQIMPATGREYGVEDPNQLFDPDLSRRVASDILSDYIGQFDGDIRRGVAAYNAGPGRVRSAIQHADEAGKDWKQFLPEETRNYIKKLDKAIKREQLRGRSR